MKTTEMNKEMKRLKLKPLKRFMDENGFTLTEMLIVVSIIGMIMAFVGSNIMKKFAGAKVDTTKIQMRSLGNALDDFNRVCGFYPDTEQGLSALIEKPTGGRECKNYGDGEFIAGKKMPKDGWNNEFKYESDGSKYTLKSMGADAKEGGSGVDADLSSDDL